MNFVKDREIAAFLFDLCERILNGHLVEINEAERIAALPQEHLLLLLHSANRLRSHFRGDAVTCCSIVNAKSGSCPEDCAFCSQSAHHNTDISVYPLLDTGQILKAADQASQDGATGFGVVISGPGIQDEDELHRVGGMLEAIARETGLEAHGSLGALDETQLKYLKSRGLVCFNHNLETAESFFGEIVTTHTYQDRVETVRAAKQTGVRVCCGGIFGIGETPAQRIELAMALRDLDVDVIPLNFLHPIPGTPLDHIPPLSPQEILSIIALFRFVLPEKEIKVAGGREKNLRDLQSMIFFAGADGMIIGNYLTTPGRNPEADLAMLKDLGLSIR
ncbi:MAG: biotin synthase BioB [bacterium]